MEEDAIKNRNLEVRNAGKVSRCASSVHNSCCMLCPNLQLITARDKINPGTLDFVFQKLIMLFSLRKQSLCDRAL